jgi:ATP-dependent DNA helicase PIF1
MAEKWPDGYENSELFKHHPELYKALFVDKRNVFLSGEGGTGKSWIVANMIKPESDRLAINCVMTSTTGVSANRLGRGAQTVHRWSGIRLGDKPADVVVGWIKQRPETKKRWKECKILIIDEMSMLNSVTFELLDEVGQRIKYNMRDLKAFRRDKIPIPTFGGIQLMATADFLQLPPVDGKFAFETALWERMNFFNYRLWEPKRYADLEHFQRLQRVRLGEMTDQDIEDFRARVKACDEYKKREREEGLDEEIKPTRIFARRADVDGVNVDELDNLEGEIICYESSDHIVVKQDKEGKHLIDPEKVNRLQYSDILDEICPPEVHLKPGAQVMLTRNLSVEQELVNGSRGIVEACLDDRVTVKFRSGESVDIVPYPHEFEDETVVCVRNQIPLILAWASTIHKSQSTTLDYVIGDCGTSVFAPGMAYVLLSRCKTLKGMLLSNFMAKMVKPHPKALEFEKKVRENSVMAAASKPIDENKIEDNKEVRNENEQKEGEIKDEEIKDESAKIKNAHCDRYLKESWPICL